jgi:hypothetical protein
MTERRFNDPRRGGSRYGGGRPDENAQPARPEPKRDPGAYIGRMPERSIGSAQGGFAPRDRRDNAPAPQPQPQTQTQPEPVAVNASVTPESPAAPRMAEPAAATPSKESSESTESRAGTEAPVAAATAAGTTATAPETGQGS